MGVAIGDYDRNGTMDIFKTNFAGDTSTLYANSGQRLLRGPDVRRAASASTRAGSAGAPASSTSTTTAGSTSSWRTATSIPRWRSSRRRRPTSSARSSTAISGTAGSRTSRERLGAPATDAQGRPRRRLRRLRQRRRRGRRDQQRPRRPRPLPDGDAGRPNHWLHAEARRARTSNRSAIGARVRLRSRRA